MAIPLQSHPILAHFHCRWKNEQMKTNLKPWKNTGVTAKYLATTSHGGPLAVNVEIAFESANFCLNFHLKKLLEATRKAHVGSTNVTISLKQWRHSLRCGYVLTGQRQGTKPSHFHKCWIFRSRVQLFIPRNQRPLLKAEQFAFDNLDSSLSTLKDERNGKLASHFINWLRLSRILRCR